MNRRGFIKHIGLTGAAALSAAPGARAQQLNPADQSLAVLVDTTLCVGCRACEKACNEADPTLPMLPGTFFNDTAVFDRHRRMDAAAYTVVNHYEADTHSPTYVKFQCMHCLQPACVSACLVGALTRDANGAVVYDEKNVLAAATVWQPARFRYRPMNTHQP